MTTPIRTIISVAAAFGGMTVTAQPFFTLTDLGNPTPEASDLTPYINDSGTIVVTSTLTGGFDWMEGGIVGQGGDQVHVFRNGSFERIQPFKELLPGMRAVAINNNGQIAGWAYDYEAINSSNAWVYELSTGTLRDLDDETSDQAWGFTFDINDNGVVLGTNQIDWRGNAWVYDGTDVVFLDDVYPVEKLYYDINNENQVLGEHYDVGDTGGVPGYFVYDLDTGTAEQLGDGTYFAALNDLGVAAGVRQEDPVLAIREGGVTQFYDLPGAGVSVSAINNSNWVVGHYFFGSGTGTYPYLFDGSQPMELSSRVVNAGGWTLERAMDVNELGQIVGRMRNSQGDLHLYRLDPIDGVTAYNDWQNIPIEAQYGTFTLTYDAIPSAVGIDAVTGLSRTPADWYTDLAPIVRFAPSGKIDARNGTGYQAMNVLNYQGGVTYQISMTVDLWARTYSATVTPDGGTPVVIATDFVFRPEQSLANELKNLGFVASGGYLIVRNVALQGSGSSAIFSAGTWENAQLDPHGSVFTVEYDVVPSRGDLDAVTGLSNGDADWFDDLAAIVRFAPSGFIDARNGGAYQAAATVPYVAGVSYHVELSVNLGTGTYSATVTPNGGSAATVANNYAFRLEQANVSELDTFVLFSSGGGATEVTNLTVD